MADTESEMKSEVNVEPEPCSKSEPFSEPEPSSAQPEPIIGSSEPITVAEPTTPIAAITIPTILLILLILSGLFVLVTKRRQQAKRRLRKNVSRSINSLQQSHQLEEFLTDFDNEVLENMEHFYNRPKELMCLATPALISIVQAPLVLYLYPTLTTLMWPSMDTAPNVNDAIACFLMPAGLVYATVFASTFATASEKLSTLQTKFLSELSMLDQIYTLTSKLDLSAIEKMKICKAVKTETIYMLVQIQGRDIYSFQHKPTTDIKVQIWKIINSLRNLSVSSADYITQYMIQHILNHMIALNSICSDNNCMLKARIHPMKWTFLELLGFFSFFGVALIDTQSTVLSLAICMITVFSISILCFVIADLDNPFSGFFRLDISLLTKVVKRGERMYNQLKDGVGGNQVPQYGEISEFVSSTIVDKFTYKLHREQEVTRTKPILAFENTSYPDKVWSTTGGGETPILSLRP